MKDENAENELRAAAGTYQEVLHTLDTFGLEKGYEIIEKNADLLAKKVEFINEFNQRQNG